MNVSFSCVVGMAVVLVLVASCVGRITRVFSSRNGKDREGVVES